MVGRITNTIPMNGLVRRIRQRAATFTRIIPLFAKLLVCFVGSQSAGAATRGSEIVVMKILISEECLS